MLAMKAFQSLLLGISTVLLTFANPILIFPLGLFDVVQAQTLEEQKAEADRLFDEGLQLYKNDHVTSYQEAISKFQSALNIYQLAQDVKKITDSNYYLALLNSRLGLGNEALFFYKVAIEGYQHLNNKIRQANSWRGIGLIQFNQGQFDLALSSYQKALALDKEENNLRGISITLNNLGGLYHRIGEIEKALDYDLQSLEISESLDVVSGQARTLSNISGIYSRLGELENALAYSQKALTLARADGNRYLEARIMHTIGVLYYRSGESEKTIDFYQKSLELSMQLGDRENEGHVLLSLGYLKFAEKNYLDALSYYQKSLAIWKLLSDPTGEVRTLNEMGLVQEKLGNIEKALSFYQQALFISKKIGILEEESQILSNIGTLFKNQNRDELSIVFYKQAVNIYESLRANIHNLDRDLQQSYLEKISSTYRNLANLLLSQGRIPEAQQVLELLKVQEITGYTRSADIGNQGAIATNPQETEVLDTHGTLIALGQKISDCEASDCDDATYSQLLDDQEIIAARFESVVRELEEEVSDRLARDSDFLDPHKLTNISDKIVNAQPHTVLIYPLVLEDKLWILWSAAGGITSSMEVKDVGLAELSQKITELREYLDTPNSNLSELKATSKQIYGWLIPAELRQELEENNIENLVFSLDSVTRYIPIDVLFDGEKYLLENYTISTILAAQLTDLDERLPTNPSILAGGLSEAVAGFNPLPNVPLELDTITLTTSEDPLGIYPGAVLLNQDFTQTAIRNNLRRHNILHLATHGEFVPGDKSASYLLLGEGEKYPIPEIQNLRNLSNIHLVVLSACETALGGSDADGTEIAGISSYFLNGGADAVIASLWKVGDESTRLLMELFYQNLAAGMGKAKALQQAKISLILQDEQLQNNLARDFGNLLHLMMANRRTANFEHPYHWASFILIGNGL